MELDDFVTALDALVRSGPERHGDGESIVVLQKALSRFESFVTEATSVFEASEEWAADGAKTAAAWITKRCQLPRTAARRRVRLGRTLRQLPQCAEAWREGRIGTDQARAIASAKRHRTEEAMARDEEMLVTYAQGMGFEDFYRALSYWKQLADPEGADEAEEDRRTARHVYLEPSIDGMFLGQMTLDPISGAIVSGELERLERQMFEDDCAEARERLGRTPHIGDLQRDSGQRRADALVEMATRSRTAPADGIRPAPLFSIFVGYETLHGRICELENGIVLSPSALLPWMDSAYFERAVFSLGTRIDVSVRARLFSGGTRRAIELRDRICTHPYCYEPAENCEADHIALFSEGGPTTQENGRLLCGFHNRLRNQPGFRDRDWDRGDGDPEAERRSRPPPGEAPAA
ncbi:MAG TPA: DUF222 domain-containing protein [Acidimicrobiales bacterium]|nr:DUF222 domain-containing protein [Acidimicrobiales bacterium]